MSLWAMFEADLTIKLDRFKVHVQRLALGNQVPAAKLVINFLDLDEKFSMADDGKLPEAWWT